MSGQQLDIILAKVPDKLFHGYRILIMTALKVADGEIRFQELKRILQISDGNLASHLRALEQEGYVKGRSFLEGRKLKALYRITPNGSRAFKEFCENMQTILNTNK
jgi:DNA-binding HxlR family transcriptional regulator